MKQYRRVREKHGLMEMFKTPEIAATVTLQPLRAFAVDAAILFADILLPLEGMGIRLEFAEGRGPVIANPVRTGADVDALRIADPEADLGYMLETVRLVRQELASDRPLIGFAGAPFTLASYAIEGGGSSGYLRTKSLMHGDPQAWDRLMAKLSATVTALLKAQVRSGADVVQLFDSWAGCLSPSDYERCVLPHTRLVLEALREQGIRSIHFAVASAGLLPLLARAGGDIVGVDWRVSLRDAWEHIGTRRGVQGNLDPAALLAPRPFLLGQAARILDEAGARAGHIFNLGHGILPETPEDAVRALADFVHEYSNRPG